MTKDNNNMTKKDIEKLASELLSQMNIVPSKRKSGSLDFNVLINERSIENLANKIVARLIQLKELTIWHDRLHNTTQVDWEYIDMTEEEELLSELARLMTLMNLFTDKEEYEKCALLKARITDIKRQLKKYEDDEI